MKPGSLRYLIDLCLYLLLGALAAAGMLLAFFVPRGPEGPKYFLGLHRRAWVDIHYWLAILFAVVVLLHLFLNWGWIKATSKRLLGPRWGGRLLLLSIAWLPLLCLAWLLAYC